MYIYHILKRFWTEINQRNFGINAVQGKKRRLEKRFQGEQASASITCRMSSVIQPMTPHVEVKELEHYLRKNKVEKKNTLLPPNLDHIIEVLFVQ